jgi:lipopolysaccharide biosynthesis regulator YciM
MIARYRAAVDRSPGDLALAVALGRVYFELEMLDEAAEHFERLEARAPDLPAIHAFLGAIFERRGQAREAFAEYRRGLQALLRFGLPYQCAACRQSTPGWQDRCPSCGRWNTLRTQP